MLNFILHLQSPGLGLQNMNFVWINNNLNNLHCHQKQKQPKLSPCCISVGAVAPTFFSRCMSAREELWSMKFALYVITTTVVLPIIIYCILHQYHTSLNTRSLKITHSKHQLKKCFWEFSFIIKKTHRQSLWKSIQKEVEQCYRSTHNPNLFEF